MTRRGLSLFAVIASLIVLSAGAAAMITGMTDASGDSGPTVGVADEPPELYSEFEEALAMAPASSVLLSPSEKTSRNRESETQLHSWRCPICHETKLSLRATSGNPGEAAAHNLKSHIRNTDGNGHRRLGEVPADITWDVLENNVQVDGAARS